MRVLAASVEPLSVPAIHEAVELALGRSVARSTVKNCLAREARDGRLVRLGRGRYCLIDDSLAGR
jgi:predicted transcriptional regulator of viral defense system